MQDDTCPCCGDKMEIIARKENDNILLWCNNCLISSIDKAYIEAKEALQEAQAEYERQMDDDYMSHMGIRP